MIKTFEILLNEVNNVDKLEVKKCDQINFENY
jgi:hypothetical protein